MIAKLIAHGDDRASALARMRGALAEVVIDGHLDMTTGK